MKLISVARALREAGADIDERREIIENENYASEYQMSEMYDEFLDQDGEVRIGSLSYQPSEVLKNVDPTAYRCGFVDFTDNYTEFIVEGRVYYTEGIY